MTKEFELRQRVEKLNNYFKNDTKNQSLALELAELHIQLSNFDSAIEVLETAITTVNDKPITDSLLFKKSNILLAQKQPSEALRTLDQIDNNNASEKPILINKAYAHFQMSNFSETISTLEGLDSLSAPSLAVLHARALHYLERINEGVDILKGALLRFPENTEVSGLLSLMLLDSGQMNNETLLHAERSLKQNPNQVESLLTAGMVQQHHLKDLKKAETYFDKAINTNPNVGRGWLYKGLSLMLAEKIKEAQEYLLKACELMPEHIGSWHSMGWSHLLLSELKDAENCFSTAMELDRNFSESHGGLAVVQALMGNKNEAEQHAKVALRLNNQCFSAKYALLILASPEKSADTTHKILAEVFSTEQGKEAEDFLKLLHTNKTIK